MVVCYNLIYKLNFKSSIYLGLGLTTLDESEYQNDTDTETDAHLDELREKYKRLGGLPAYFNWIDENVVTWPRNQGQCGSCADFATSSMMETCFIRVCRVLQSAA